MRRRTRHRDPAGLAPAALTPEERAELELESARALADPYGDLRRAADDLQAVTRRLAARPRPLHRRIRLTASRPFRDFTSQHGYPWLSVLVENPNNAAIVDVGLGGAGTGQPGQSDTRVPPNTGKLIAARFESVSVGIDAADAELVAAGATGLEVFVVLYDELLPPTAYALAI